jgi:CBS domain-containing protein
MAQSIREVMTSDPRTCDAGATLQDAAREMRDGDIGDVIVTRDGALCGIVTDRDIVVRAIAEGRDPGSTRLEDICTESVQTLTPDQTVEEAIRMMREHDIRRIPVVQEGRPAGIVALGDLAVERDAQSALADISAAAPNN